MNVGFEMLSNLHKQINNQVRMPIERQARIIRSLAWGVIWIAIIGCVTTWFLAGSKLDGLQLILGGGALIVVCGVSIFFSYQRKIKTATIMLVSILYLVTTIMMLPYGILRSDVMFFGYFLPLVLLGEFWRLLGVILSFILTSISLFVVYVLEFFRLAAWSTRSDVLEVKVGFVFATMFLVAHVILRAKREVDEINEELILANNKIKTSEEHLKRFAWRIVHDLSAPLQGLRVITEDMDQFQKSSVRSHTDILQSFVEQIRSYVELRDLSSTLNLAAVSILPICAASMMSITGKARLKRVTLELDCQEDEILCLGDEVAIRRIFDNLLSNAVRETDEKSTVIVHIYDLGNFVKIAIEDFGPGIPISQQDYIFDSRWSEPTRIGWGLGLTIVRELATAMHGSYGVTNNPKRGCTFWVQLSKVIYGTEIHSRDR